VIADTSVTAYHEHRDTGKLSRQANTILSQMRSDTDYSRRELARHTGLELSSVCGRVNELLAIGLLEELASRRCSITGKTVHPVKLSSLQPSLF
jgi:hypothetical protein